MTRVPRTSLASRTCENDTASAYAQEHVACFLVDLLEGHEYAIAIIPWGIPGPRFSNRPRTPNLRPAPDCALTERHA